MGDFQKKLLSFDQEMNEQNEWDVRCENQFKQIDWGSKL